MAKIKFVFGRVFPPDQLMSRWVATLALAFNDLALVHARLEEDQDTAHKFLYWLRLGIAHFHEAAAFIAASSEVKEVRDLVATLSADAQESYADCLKRFKTRETPVARLRNQAASTSGLSALRPFVAVVASGRVTEPAPLSRATPGAACSSPFPPRRPHERLAAWRWPRPK